MYKLIIVDDESEVRKGIVQKIPWGQYGFKVVGEAENGREALEIAEKVNPDVVITDIKMPFMDGLKLAEALRMQFPTTKVIILTGFDEFEYAREAIKLNVIQYVLKPISAKELVDVLIEVKAQIDEEIAQKEDIEALREHYYKSLPVLREKFLASLVSNKLSRRDILDKSKRYGIDLNGKQFVVSVLSIDNMLIESDDSSGQEQTGTTESLWQPEDSELLKCAVFNISEEIVNKHALGLIFIHNEYIVIISSSMEEDSEAMMNKTLSVLEEIRGCVEKYLKFAVTIGVGTACDDITGIRKSYENALSVLDYRLILGIGRVICIEDVEPKNFKQIEFDELKEHSLVRCIKVGTEKEIKRVIDNLFGEIMEAKVSFKEYQVYLLEMLTTVLKVAKDLDVDMDDVFGLNYNLFVEMYKFKDIQDVKEWFTEICIKITGYITRERQDTRKLLVAKARDYLQKNYHDCDMTIDKVCKYLHISPPYFSAIFKKETKMTFVNYLTQLRMGAAKELLRTTNLKTFEIAEKVGYSEPNYFSYCFKKHFGISPSEYRNSA